MIGQTVSHYTILEELGRGGMGVVYKAKDTTLDRFVALKFLPPHLAASAGDKERFIQEAKAASSINHPNICTIHAVGEHEGQLFIVMEFVDGQTLAERKTAVTQKQAIEFGIQIAEGLAAAHEKGIVHRDIKPENIMVRKDGIVQIMDFGLAKLAGVSRLTKEGSTVGTAGYMSPEQVQGLDVDHRTDIFSFGVLLYEMLGGELPFKGAHETAMMYEIVNVEAVPLSAAHPDIDQELDAIVLECLAKDPDERYQSIKEVSKDLRRFKRTSSKARVSRVMPTRPMPAMVQYPAAAGVPAGEAGPAHPSPRRRLPMIWIGSTAVLLLGVIALTAALLRSGGGSEAILRASLLSPPGVIYNTTVGGHLALSPDGTRLAFVAADSMGRQSLWVRSLALMNATILPGTDRAAYPFWSPDSRSLGFFADGKLKRIEVAGGPPLTVCDAPGGRGGSWNDAGVILFAGGSGDPISRVSTGGGNAEPVTALDTARGETSHRWPWFLPDQKHFLFTSQVGTQRVGSQEAVYLAALGESDRSLLLYAASNAVYANGHILFAREQSLVARPFDADALELRGDAFPVSDLVQYNQARSRGIFSASTNGMLVYQAGTTEDARLVWVDGKGAIVGPIVGRAPSYFCKISPDGGRVVFDDYDAESRNTDLWLHDLKRDVTTRFTFHATDDLVAVWTHDGQNILYSSNQNGPYEVFIKAANGAEKERLLLSDGVNELYPTGITPDGRFVMLTRRVPSAAKWDLYYADLHGEKKPIPFLATEFNEWLGEFSPDGRWVAYQSDESGKYEVYVRPFPGGGGKWQLSTGGGQGPFWGKDGKQVFYESGTGKLTAVKVQPGDQTLMTGIPQPLFDLAGREQYTIFCQSPDGTRFVASLSAGERSSNPVTLVINWHRELERNAR